MSFSQLYLLLAVSSFPWIIILAVYCDERHYLHNGFCCEKCQPGYEVATNCSDISPTRCQLCISGFYSNDWSSNESCQAMNPCNKSREYIEVPASVNRTEDNLCGCEDGWYQNYTTDNDSVCLENQMCPPGEGVADYGQCRQCHSNEYSDEWSTTQRCQPQPNCTEEVGGVVFEGNVTERTICNNTKDTIEGDLAKNSTLATSPNEMYMKNIINESTPYTHITNMTTTMTSILKKAEKEGELNYKLITVGAIVSGGLIAVIVAFVISEIRRVYRRRKGLMPSDAPPTRTTNSKGMAVQFADKRKKAKAEKSRTRKLENEATGEANENTPMLMETIERNDVRVVVWQPNKPGPEPELTIPLESWTPNSEERVTCV